MKTVTVYEVSQAIRTLEGGYHEIPIHEIRLDGGRAWGNPGGGDKFVRYSLPVTHIVEERVEDGFTHRKDSYVAIGPRLLELIAPAVNAALARACAGKTSEIIRLELDAKRRGECCDELLERVGRLNELISNRAEELRNFREANVLTRIWRAITRAI